MAVTSPWCTTRKRFSGAALEPSGKGFPDPATWHTDTPTVPSSGGLCLLMELMFMKLVVDATWRDAEQAGRLRLVPTSLVQSGFE
jgi:hypothetical protein